MVLWFALDWLIVTDTERIERILDEMAGAAIQGDVEGLTRPISERYSHEGMTRADLVQMAEAYFHSYGPTRIRTIKRAILVTKNLAAADWAVFARVIEGGQRGTGTQSRWQISFRKRDGRWEVSKVSPIELHRQGISGWGPLRGGLHLPRRRKD